MIAKIQRLEGLAIFILSLFFLYSFNNWPLFIIGLLLVDLSMIGYLRDRKTGATIYNLVHNYALGVLLIILSLLTIRFFTDTTWLLMTGIIITAHVGIDRFLGFGLKHPDNFKHTHLS